MRPLRHASPLVRMIATLGVLITLQAIAVLRYGDRSPSSPSELPTDVVAHPRHDRDLGRPLHPARHRRRAHARACGCSTATRSSASRRRRSPRTSAPPSSLGLVARPDRHAQLGARLGLAGVAAILIVPIVTLQLAVLTNLVLAATAAALVAGFRSFPIAFAAGMLDRHRPDRARPLRRTSPASATRVPFVVIIVWLMVRGQALPLRDYFLQRLPTIGSGRLNWRGIAFGVGDRRRPDSTTTSRSGRTRSRSRSPSRVVLLSIVVLTGYAGQLSLGAVRARRLRRLGRRPPAGDAASCPFWLGLLVGVVGDDPARGALRAAGGAHARHQPRHRHARPGHGDRADALQQRRLHRRLRRHPDRQADACSG